MREFELTEEDSEQPISDPNLEEISRTSIVAQSGDHCLPILNYQITWWVTSNVIARMRKRGETTSFFTWKHKKGTRATYRKLVCALLKIDCRRDADSLASQPP